MKGEGHWDQLASRVCVFHSDHMSCLAFEASGSIFLPAKMNIHLYESRSSLVLRTGNSGVGCRPGAFLP